MSNDSNGDSEEPSVFPLHSWFVYHFKRDWPIMKKAPLGLAAFTGLILIAAWFFIWHVIVPEKNEQLSSKQDTIQAKEATIQQLQTALAVNGLNTFPLKKRANTLADQLDKYADNMPTNDSQKLNEYTMNFNDR